MDRFRSGSDDSFTPFAPTIAIEAGAGPVPQRRDQFSRFVFVYGCFFRGRLGLSLVRGTAAQRALDNWPLT